MRDGIVQLNKRLDAFGLVLGEAKNTFLHVEEVLTNFIPLNRVGLHSQLSGNVTGELVVYLLNVFTLANKAFLYFDFPLEPRAFFPRRSLGAI